MNSSLIVRGLLSEAVDGALSAAPGAGKQNRKLKRKTGEEVMMMQLLGPDRIPVGRIDACSFFRHILFNIFLSSDQCKGHFCLGNELNPA